jgi:hypothetical protein
MKDTDIDLALFGLAGFVQYRLDDGMDEAELEPFMQAYLNLMAERMGLEPLSLQALRVQTVVASQEEQEAIRQWRPAWLPDAEKLRHHRLGLRRSPSTSGLDDRA